MAARIGRTAFAPAIDMALDDEVRRMQVCRLDALQRDRIAGRQVDHGIARAVVADHALQRSPIRKAVVLDVDQIVLGRRAADGAVALTEILDHILARALVEHEDVAVRSAPHLVIAALAVQDVPAARDRTRRGWIVVPGVTNQNVGVRSAREDVVAAMRVAGHGKGIADDQEGIVVKVAVEIDDSQGIVSTTCIS